MTTTTIEQDTRNKVYAYIEDMAERAVPEHLRESLAWYIVAGRPVGDFLTAVLTNDLKECVARGDENSLAGLVAIVRYLYNRVPIGAWGTPGKVKAWRGMVPR